MVWATAGADAVTRPLPARKRLRAWICAQGMTQAQFAELIGSSSATVCCLIAGRYDPKLRTAIRIEDHTGIPVRAWLT